jgi:hypothetical protein
VLNSSRLSFLNLHVGILLGGVSQTLSHASTSPKCPLARVLSRRDCLLATTTMSRLSTLGTFVFIRKERVRFVGAVVSITALYFRFNSSSRMMASIEYGSSSSREGIGSLKNIVRKSSPLILAKLDRSCTSLLERSVFPEPGYPVSTRFQGGNAQLLNVSDLMSLVGKISYVGVCSLPVSITLPRISASS